MRELESELEAQRRMEDVWRGRAERLSKRPVVEETGEKALPVIVLGIGNERYGIDFPDVAEILAAVRITPVPGAAAVFAGVVNVHGEIRPVIDLRRLLGMETAGSSDPARVILLRSEDREMGLRTDTVEQVGWIEPGNPGSVSKYVRRTTKDLLMLLSTEALFAELNA